MEVVMRMLRMETVQKEALDGVERTLRTEFMSNLARTSAATPHEVMAEIFNNLDRQAEARILAALEERNRESAERIRALMFTFDDLSASTRRHADAAARACRRTKLTLALKGASRRCARCSSRNMSERAAKMLRDDLDEAWAPCACATWTRRRRSSSSHRGPRPRTSPRRAKSSWPEGARRRDDRAIVEAVKPRIDRAAARAGFPGSVILLGDPAMSDAQSRIEWADGGVERDTARIWGEFDAILQRHLAGASAHAPETLPTENPHADRE
jgi:hypothetical protein